MTFPMVDDHSCDFVFSFDSLVHVDLAVMESYIKECLRVLRPGRVAFLHHSNAGIATPETPAWKAAKTGYRAFDVTAEKVRAYIASVGGTPLLQECVNWNNDECTDCITVFGGAELRGNDCRVIENPRFMLEAEMIKNTTAAYWEIGAGEEKTWL
jgi:SAM-dependent methyltransferase